jgi:hypothetical protein
MSVSIRSTDIFLLLTPYQLENELSISEEVTNVCDNLRRDVWRRSEGHRPIGGSKIGS